jgi:hypothetical protein
MRPFAPGLHFVDSHSQQDTQNCSAFTFQIKPDVCVYSKSPHSGAPPKGCDASKLDIHIEFKWDAGHDPFCTPYSMPPSSAQCFLRDTNKANDTLGQITAYTAAQVGSQYRTHAFSVLIVRDTARIIRWDREGAVVTTPINYNSDLSLAEFFSRYAKAPPELRGVDTTVSSASKVEAKSARAALKLPGSRRMLKTSVRNTGGDGTRTLIIPAPIALAMAPIGRGTRACPAYDPVKQCVVFFKDSWRINFSGIHPEGETYAKLNAANVGNVATCLACGDVPCWPEQETQTKKLSFCDWACHVSIPIIPHTHYRLVLDLVGNKLTEFTSSRELVQAVRDALVGESIKTLDHDERFNVPCTAHQRAFELGILHRDISAGNIVIVFGRGILIDWDLAKEVSQLGPRQTTRTVC